jgi:hypothetical protein
MQAIDLFSDAGSKFFEAVKITFFRMLPRGAQIDKVRREINTGPLRHYGKMTKLEIDRDNKTISLDLDLKGEKESVQIKVSNYRLHHADGQNPVFEPGTVEASREWINTLIKELVTSKVLPERIEVKNAFQLAVVKAIL